MYTTPWRRPSIWIPPFSSARLRDLRHSRILLSSPALIQHCTVTRSRFVWQRNAPVPTLMTRKWWPRLWMPMETTWSLRTSREEEQLCPFSNYLTTRVLWIRILCRYFCSKGCILRPPILRSTTRIGYLMWGLSRRRRPLVLVHHLPRTTRRVEARVCGCTA